MRYWFLGLKLEFINNLLQQAWRLVLVLTLFLNYSLGFQQKPDKTLMVNFVSLIYIHIEK